MYRLIKVDDSKKMRMLEVTQNDLFGHKPATGNRSRGAFSKEIQEGQGQKPPETRGESGALR